MRSARGAFAPGALPAGGSAEVRGSRPVVIALCLVLVVALQSTALTRVSLFGVVPQLIAVVVICFAYLEGDAAGPVVGFSAGLLMDLAVAGSIVGVTALIYTLVAYGAARYGQSAPRDSLLAPVLAVTLGTLAIEAGYPILSMTLGQEWAGLGASVRIVLLVTAYNALLAPFVFRGVRRIADALRPRRVVRI